MKILHVFHDHGYGGIQQHILLLMKGLRERGHEVFFAGPRDSWIADRLTEEGFGIVHLPMHGLWDIVSHVRLQRWARCNGMDVVHGHGVRGAYYAGKCSGFALTVCTAHSTKPPRRMGGCRKMIAISEAVKRVLLAAGNREEKISVIPHGVPDVPGGDRLALRQELGIAPTAFALVNAARFIRDKGQDVLVDMMAKFPSCVGGDDHGAPSFHLYLIGDPDTDFGRTLQQKAAGMGGVHFLGYRGDVQRLLPAFDAYVSAARREAFGLSLVEAFAAHLPVVATDVGGVAEVVTEGETGFLVPSENAAALADAIRKLHDAPLRTALATVARKRYETLFTTETMVEKTERLY